MWYTRFRSYWQTLNDPPETRLVVTRSCAHPSCAERGEYRAPKSRAGLQDYYWFCLDHVREYNKNWDFFKGMSQAEIEAHMRRTSTWDLPTWRATRAGLNEERARQRVYESFAKGESVFGSFGAETEDDVHVAATSIPHPAAEALAVMGLSPPADWDVVKARYKQLAKTYHPDRNPGNEAEETLKKINLAYSILKLSYQRFIQMDQHS